MRIWNRIISARTLSHFPFFPVEFHMHTKRKPCWLLLEIRFFSSLHFHQGVCLEYPNSTLQSVKVPEYFLSPCDGPFLCVYKTLNIYLWKFLPVSQSSSFPPRLLCAWFLHPFPKLYVHIPMFQVFAHLGVPTPFLEQHLILFPASFLISLIHLCFSSLTSTIQFFFSHLVWFQNAVRVSVAV